MAKKMNMMFVVFYVFLSLISENGCHLYSRNEKIHQDIKLKDDNKSGVTEFMYEKATFAAGCFWGVEEVFRQVPGVIETAVGYTGGWTDNPTYEQVCTGNTGHAESVEIVYDPTKVSYESLLEIFWNCHDPTQLNRQGPDVGTQYRSAIFYHTEEQRKLAEESKNRLTISGKFPKPIVTQILPASTFWRAEEYHQRYLEKRGLGKCR